MSNEGKYVSRIQYIDGIRGWAALAVLCFHASAELFGRVDGLHGIF